MTKKRDMSLNVGPRGTEIAKAVTETFAVELGVEPGTVNWNDRAQVEEVENRVLHGALTAWELAFKVGKGLDPAVARPYAEKQEGKRPCDLLSPLNQRNPEHAVIAADFDAGFIAGYRSHFAGEGVEHKS